MSNKNGNIVPENVQSISENEIETLRKSVRTGWIQVVEVIYNFGHLYNRKQIEKTLAKYSLKLTKNANAWTGVAKLATMEQETDGSWSVSDTNVSRFAKVCMYLQSRGAKPGQASTYLKNVTLNSICTKQKPKIDQDALQNLIDSGIFAIENEFKERVDPQEKLNLENLGFEAGATLAVVIVDDSGNVVGVEPAPFRPAFEKIKIQILTNAAPKTTTASNDDSEVSDDPIEQAAAA